MQEHTQGEESENEHGAGGYEGMDVQDNESLDEDRQTCKDTLAEAVSYFVANMKATAIPYSNVQQIIYEVEGLVEIIANHLQHKLSSIVEEVQTQFKEANLSKFETVFQECEVVKKTFEGLRSQYQQDKYFKDKGYFISPEERVLGQSFTSQSDTSTGGVKQKVKNDSFQYVPMKKTLRKHLEQPGVMAAILHQQPCEDGLLLQSYRDGSYFKGKFSASADVVIPILLYCDDYETGNPLGSKKGINKLTGFYISLLCLPAQFQASLSNILLAACAKRSEVAKYGIDSILSVIVKDLNDIERQGIEVSCQSYSGLVRPVVFQVIGDNLGLHETLGFVGSFSANYPCRFCKAPKEITKKQLVEDVSLLRDKNSFEADLVLDNVSKTGIKRSSELNKLTGFHVTDNHVTDVMHDLLEGIFPLEIKLTLGELIDEGCFTLEEVNNRISSFGYGFADKKSKPSIIQDSALRNPSGSSGQKAAQTRILALYLPLIIGDLVDEESDVWEMFLLLLDIYKIVVAPRISHAGVYILKALIADHHRLFLSLFQDRHLIPKQHFLIHYPRVIQLLGPLEQYSSMRKEGKHKPFKRWARACNNYKNVAKTVSIRHQQQQSYTFLLRKPLNSELEVRDQISVLVSSLDEVNDVCSFLGCGKDAQVILSGSVSIQTYTYKPNCMILVDWTAKEPQFSQVKHIIIVESSIYFVLRSWHTKYYNRHRHSYAVEESESVFIKQPKELLVCRPFHATKCSGKDDSSWYIITPFNLV
jgi:hypothetical protein